MREDWIEVELGEVCQVNMGQSPPSSTYNTDKIGLPFFQGKAEFTELFPVVEKWCSEPTKIAEPFDILLSVRAPVGATNVANQKCAIGRGLAAISYKYDYKYILYFLRLIEKKLDSQGTGTTFRAISGGVLKSQLVPIPPLPIQRAIVTKLENLFASLDKGIADLKTAQDQLKVYRQAVLNEHLSRHQDKWEIKELSTIIDVKDGTHDTPKYFDSGIPFVTQKNIKEIGLTFESAKFISTEEHEKFYKRSNVAQNDILISMIGANRGMACIVETDKIFSIKNVGLLKSNPLVISNKYLLYFLKSQFAKEYIKSKSKGGAQEFIGLTELRKFPIPFISLSEQKNVVKEIESRLSVCDKVEQSIAESLEQAKALRQSILKKAFEGKLLSEAEIAQCKQEADYEPASVLLERIKKEKKNGK